MLGYKPQIALLVPIALAAAGLWRVFGAACPTIIGLSVTATLAFGPAVWPAWISMLPAYARWFDTVRRLLKFKPTVIANFDVAGVALPVAEGIQLLSRLEPRVGLFSSEPRTTRDRRAAGRNLSGDAHSFVYNLPMITAAMALFIEAKMEGGAEFTLAEIAILALAFIFHRLRSRILSTCLSVRWPCCCYLAWFCVLIDGSSLKESTVHFVKRPPLPRADLSSSVMAALMSAGLEAAW